MPTGIVTFKDGKTILGTPALSDGTATLLLTNLGIGRHTITASYAGDSNFLASSSARVTETVVNSGLALAKNGVYSVTMQSNQVTNTSGNRVMANQLHALTLGTAGSPRSSALGQVALTPISAGYGDLLGSHHITAAMPWTI